jgi:hypothetical protein
MVEGPRADVKKLGVVGLRACWGFEIDCLLRFSGLA